MKQRGMFWVVLALGILIISTFSVLPASGEADEVPAIKNMKVSLWPEYDDPRVLVIYEGEFYNDVTFPQSVNFPAPLGSEISQVCALQPPDDNHLCQLYETTTGAESLSISYDLPIPTYYLEYYWDGIEGKPDKAFSFRYVSPYAVDTLEIEVQQPLESTNFNLVPQYASSTSDGTGLKYYNYTFTDVMPGQVINIDAAYFKPDDKLSVATSQVGVSPAGGGGSGSYAWIGILAGVAAVGAGFFLLRRKQPAVARAASRRAARAEAKRVVARRAQRPAESPTAASGQGNGALFCSFCGTKLASKAVFCHRCGASMKHVN